MFLKQDMIPSVHDVGAFLSQKVGVLSFNSGSEDEDRRVFGIYAVCASFAPRQILFLR